MKAGRGWLVGSACALLVAVVVAAAVGGWWLANSTLVASHESSSAPVPEVQVSDAGFGVQMPDVRGLELATALQVLADSGIPADHIVTHEAPSVVTAGVVVEQSPAFGASQIAVVDLGVAVSASMPALGGKTQDEAVEVLSGFGTAVEITYGYSKDAAPGTVLSVSPATGEPLGQAASLVVATAGSTLPLTQVHTIAGGCRTRTAVAIDGRDYTTALACEARTDRAVETTWMLSKTVDRFTATVGIADDGVPGASAGYSVLLDGAVVAQGVADFGSSTAIDVVSTGAIQLTIRIDAASQGDVDVIFGTAVVYGSDEGIERLAALR